MILTALLAVQGIWGLVSEEPLLPYILANFPRWAQITLAITFVAMCVFCAVIVVKVYRQTKTRVKPKPEIEKKSLTDTLTAMHRRLIELQKEKASHTNIGRGQLKKVLPTLADRMGTVKHEDWPKFEREMESRIRQASPPRPYISFRGRFNFRRWAKVKEEWKDQVYRSASSVARKARDELLNIKEWTLADGIKVAEWLDGYDWGIKKLRDDDLQWKALYESIDSYLIDDILRGLIKEHIDLSHVYNNITLIIHYSSKFKDDIYSLMLYEALVGSPMSPEQVDMGLNEVLGKIEKRLKETKERIQSKIVVGGLIGRAKNVKIRDSHYKGKITTQGKPEDIDVGGLIGQGENIEVVDSSANAEIEYKQDKE